MDPVDYQLTITFEPEEDVESVVEKLFDAFNRVSPGNAVTGFSDGVFELTFCVEATSPGDAYKIGEPIFVEGMTTAGLSLRPIDLHIDRVRVEDDSRELQPA